MKKRILWTTAALLTTAVGIPQASYAESASLETATGNSQAPALTTQANVVKVGEYQSQTKNQPNSVVARIQPHQHAGQQAATVYVKNIPVLTFLDTADSANQSNATAMLQKQASLVADTSTTKTAIQRATHLAATLNQLHINGLDASQIAVKWKASGDGAANKAAGQTASDRYAINLNNQELVEINTSTRLPDQTNDLEQDALQATNRLRRLLGNAPPLQEVANKPAPQPKAPAAPQTKAPKQASAGPVQAILNGMASWYGPGFHGNRSASGERFNQNALTAAHRSLPFGTRVRVTNRRNGRSVIVRINDRGPHIRGRIIDLSAGAARILGVMQTGVAPVRVEVLGR